MPAGRKRAEPGVPPLPKQWRKQERLAVSLAYLQASEKGPNANLEVDCSGYYAAQLQFVHDNVCPFVESVHKWGSPKKDYRWTLDESKKRRANKGTAVEMFKNTRKVCNNVIMPIYYKLHNQGGEPPSGTDRELMINKIEAELAGQAVPEDLEHPQGADDETAPSPPPGAVPQEPGAGQHRAVGGGLADGAPPAPAQADSPPDKPQENLCFLTWLHLGPLGTIRSAQFMPPAKGGSTRDSAPKPPGRDAARDAVKIEKESMRASKHIEEGKLLEIQKLRKDEKKRRNIARGLLAVEKKKQKANEFDQDVSRLEKRIALTKDKKKIATLSDELDALLEAGAGDASSIEESEASDAGDAEAHEPDDDSNTYEQGPEEEPEPEADGDGDEAV